MSLMINLEDAIRVLRIEDVIKDDDEAEWFRNVLEQKCYIIMKRKSASWIDLLIGEIDEVMNAQAIAEHIADGTLQNWLECHKDIAMAKLEMLASQEAVVRCKDCKHYRATPGYCAYDRIWQENKGHVWGMYCKPDWFCADGEREAK